MQTKLGGQKATQTLLSRDPDYFKKIGALGGAKSRGGGFTNNPEAAKRAGAKGGKARLGNKYPRKVVEAVSPPTPVKKRHWGLW